MAKQFLPKALAGSKYANRLPIGKDDTIQNFKYNWLDAITEIGMRWLTYVAVAQL